MSSAVQVSCLAPRSFRSPSASYLLRRPFLPMADFRPGGIAASVHPCAHSAVRVGFFAPFLSGRHLTVSGLCGTRRTASSDMIRLSGFVTPQNHPYHTASGRKSQRPAPYKTALCRESGGREEIARRRTSPPGSLAEQSLQGGCGLCMRVSPRLRRAAAPPAPDAQQTWAPARRSCK